MKKLALLFTLLTGVAHAASLTVSWTDPVTNVDGSAVVSLISTRVEYGTCSGTAFGTKIGEVVVPQPTPDSVTIPGLTASTCYAIRAYAKSGAGESVASVVKIATTPAAPPPNPPVLGTVTTAAVEIRKSAAGTYWVVRNVGFVPLGTACTGPALVRDYYQTSPTQLSVDPATITGIVAGRCA